MPRQLPLDRLLLLCVFATGFSGVVCEYLMATMASYLIGDSITQWALTISVMLFFMGVGSQLSAKLQAPPLKTFIVCELLLSMLVSFAPSIVYGAAPYTENLPILIYFLTSILGLLIGAEIPLASQVLSQTMTLKKNIAWVLSQDYFGALLGGIFFVFVGQSYLGLAHTAVLLGAINFIIALSLVQYFPRWPLILVAMLLTLHGFKASELVIYGEQSRYRDLIVYSDQSRYQKIVITQWKDDYWLYLNGNEQFSTVDEHKYHEALVHPGINTTLSRREVLILGGGDGLAAREILKFYPDVENITVVDLDPKVTDLAKTHPILLKINEDALLDPKVRIINEDAFYYLAQTRQRFDFVIIDLPDPKTVSLARLYTKDFYSLLRKQLNHGGCLTTQALSPQFAPRSFWSINHSLLEAEFKTIPYWVNMPTLGEWGFILACHGQKSVSISNRFLNTKVDNRFKFLERDQLRAMRVFAKETKSFRTQSQSSSLNDLNVYHYYQDGRWDLY